MTSIYLRMIDYQSNVLTTAGTLDNKVLPLQSTLDPKSNQFLKVASFNSDIVQTLNIGSQSTGAGAGKVTFNPFTIRKQSDATSPTLFQNAASGTPFKTVDVFFVNEGNFITVRHTYKLGAVKTISWSADDPTVSGLMETVIFEYGGLIVTINQQSPDGRPGQPLQGGWNRVKNIRDIDLNAVIS